MAILIPSKHIYGDIENPKVRNNIITKVEIQQKVVSPDNDYEVTVFNKDIDFSSSEQTSESLNEYSDAQQLTDKTYRRAACGLQYTLTTLKTPEILIPISRNNKYISKLYDGADDEGNPKIRLVPRLKQTIYTGGCSYSPSTNTFDFGVKDEMPKQSEQTVYGFENVKYERDISSSVSFIDSGELFNLESYHSIICESDTITVASNLVATSNNVWSPQQISATADFENKYREIIEASEITKDGVDYYKLPSVNVTIGLDATFGSVLFGTSDFSIQGHIPAIATRVVLECEELTLTVHGDTVGISLTDGTLTCGSGNNPYTISRSELVQNDSSSAQSMAEKIIKEYSKGKETATIRCDIGEYYLYNEDNPQVEGAKVISASDEGLSMTFNEGDIVIPMIPSAMGGDEPMSRYQDGKPKEFRVVGTSIINDGAIWQKLYLQELLQ